MFLDLPLIRGDEVPHEPHFAPTSRNWGAAVALYSAPTDSGYILQDVFRQRSVVGTLTRRLDAGRTGLWDRQIMRVKLIHGDLQSRDVEDVLAGRNVLAVGDGSPDNWEIVQFAQAQMVDTRTFELTDLLRGQAGTSAFIADPWPVGSKVVLLDGRPRQITIPTYARGQKRHFRFGPIKRPIGDPSYRHRVLTFAGNGYRPYPVVHLKATFVAAGLQIDWTRQTRIDGDSWRRGDVPLGEEEKAFVIQILQGNKVIREVTVEETSWIYPASLGQQDVGEAPFAVAVAQRSPNYGTGPFVRLPIE